MAATQVILYFDDQKDALRFALAAGSVMSAAGEAVTDEQRNLIQETQRASTRLKIASNSATHATAFARRAAVSTNRSSAARSARETVRQNSGQYLSPWRNIS